MKPTVPYSMQQICDLKCFDDAKELRAWIDELVKVHRYKDNHPYYLHIDCIQVLPNQNNCILVLLIYHTVYLKVGE